jgi:hypothetical protein
VENRWGWWRQHNGNHGHDDEEENDDEGNHNDDEEDEGDHEDEEEEDDRDRVTICHCPPGNPNHCRTISVPPSAVPYPQSHGDQLGPCPPARPSGPDDEDD